MLLRRFTESKAGLDRLNGGSEIIMRWTITETHVLRCDGTLRESQDVIVDEDLIMDVGPGLSRGHSGIEKIIDGKDKLIIPGLVNAHLHSHDRFDKGRFDNLPLEIWMAAFNPPNGKKDWTAEEIYLRTLLNCIELIKSGTTTVVDDVAHTDLTSREKIDAVFQAYQDAGLRARVSIIFSDKPYFDTIPFLEEFLPDAVKADLVAGQRIKPETLLALWKDYGRRWRDRVGFVLSPSGPQRSSDRFLKETFRVSKELDIPVIIHVLETKVQELTGYLFYNKSLVEHMKSMDLLNRRTNLVHCVWVNDRDIELIAEAGANIIHNPVTNLKLGSGIAPVSKMLKAGINVGLGTDNNSANDSADIMDSMRMAALINKVTDSDYDTWIGAKEVIKMATDAGAHCLGLENEIGELEKGKKADFVVLDLNSLPFTPRHNILHQLVFCETGESIETVVIDGRIVCENGKILTFNEDKIKAAVQEKSEILFEKIKNSASRAHEILPYVEKAYRKCIRLSQVKPVR